MNDNEVYELVIRRDISPDQLDAWYLGLPGTPSRYQMYLYAEGRACLLQGVMPSMRMVTLHSPPMQMKRLRVRTDHVPALLVGHIQSSVTGRGPYLTWLIPAYLLESFVATLTGQGYEVDEPVTPKAMTQVYVQGDSGSAVMSGRPEYPAPDGWRCWAVPVAEAGAILKQLRGNGYTATLAVPRTPTSSIDVVVEEGGRSHRVYGYTEKAGS